MNENKRFWQTDVGRIVLLTVAVLTAALSYDYYWRSKAGPYFNTYGSIQWAKERNREMECTVDLLGNRDRADLEILGDTEIIGLGTEIRQRCENIDCVARAEAESQQVFGKRLDEWEDAIRVNVLLKHCWRMGMPGNLWRLDRE